MSPPRYGQVYTLPSPHQAAGHPPSARGWRPCARGRLRWDFSGQKDLTIPAQIEYILARIPLPTLPSLEENPKAIFNLCESRGDNLAPSHVKNSVIPAVVHTVYTEHLSRARSGPGTPIAHPCIGGAVRESPTSWVLKRVPQPPGSRCHHLLTEG